MPEKRSSFKGPNLKVDTKTINLLSDEPIVHAKQDRLKRDRFAKHLAHTLLQRQSKSCLVVAINGPWGSGKSSVLNLIENHLISYSKNERELIEVIKFNPWNVSNIDQLIAIFFREIKAVLSRGAKTPQKKQIANILDIISGMLTLGELSPVGNNYFACGAALTKKFSGTLKDLPDKTLVEMKRKLEELLSKDRRRFFVFIDDIDRLEPESMKTLFRLIRLNTDFKNITYVLSFDKNVVINALSTEQFRYSNEYLEKIVQLSIDIPETEQALLLEILNENLKEYVVNYEFDSNYWAQFYSRGRFNRFFKTMRDVIRLTNGLKVTHPLVAREVNLVDFIGLEAIRIFAPRSYDLIRRNKDIMTRLKESSVPENKQNTSEILEKIFNPAPIMDGKSQETIESMQQAEAVRDICKFLFPQLARVYFGLDNANIDDWRKKKRICSSEMFDKYFLLGVPIGEISDEEMQASLARSGNNIEFRQSVREYFDKRLGKRFIQRLSDYQEKIPSKNTKEVLIALFDEGKRIAEEPREFMGLDVRRQVEAIIGSLLARIEKAQRKAVLVDALNSATCLLIPIDFVRGVVGRSKGQMVNELEFTDADMAAIKISSLNRLEKASNDGSLSKMPKLMSILYGWRDLGAEQEIKRYCRNLIKTNSGLLDFLVGMISEGIASDTGRFIFIRKSDVNNFVGETSSIELKVRKIKKQQWDKLSKEQKEAVDAFLNPKKEY